MKATCKNSADLEEKKTNQNQHLFPFMTSFFNWIPLIQPLCLKLSSILELKTFTFGFGLGSLTTLYSHFQTSTFLFLYSIDFNLMTFDSSSDNTS